MRLFISAFPFITQTIVIIQNKESVETLRDNIAASCKASAPNGERFHATDVICLHADSLPSVKRNMVSPASDYEKKQKKRIAGISQRGDLADIIIMTSSGTRGISFPNAGRILCLITMFSVENNFMEFLQECTGAEAAEKAISWSVRLKSLFRRFL